MIPDFLFNIPPGDIGYDIETYPNVFTFTAVHTVTNQIWYFEISFRRNDLELLCLFIERCKLIGSRWVGYNNVGFDYPVVHWIYKNRLACINVTDIYEKAMKIINAFTPQAKFAHMVWESDWFVPQIDCYKIHHFDNMAKATSLKALEICMRSDNIEDLPFDVGLMLDNEQADVLGVYNLHDTKETNKFFLRKLTQDKLKLREELTESFGINMINCSDIKMGEHILVHEIEKKGFSCYEYIDGKKRKRQTKRESINLAEVIFPYVSFENSAFQRIHEHLKAKTIVETKGVFKDLVATIEGVDYKFGTGGIHASVEAQVVESDDQYQLVDVDVASFYPNLGIKNNLFPAHLGEAFCEAYLGVYHTRKTYAKGTPENEAYKLALNGAYGGSNNEYSPFYDPFYTMSITINGQLLLCMLTEQLLKVPGLKMVQANTDGITYLCPRNYLDHTRAVCKWWEDLTQLELEEALYNRMFIRDVNNYMAEYEDGKIKRIGAYAYETAEENPGTRELPYHKDWSALVVPKAAEAALVHGVDIESFITGHTDIMDFMLKAKVPRKSSLVWGGDTVANIVRYHVSYQGKILEKLMPAAGPIGKFKRANSLTNQFYESVLAEVGDAWDERIHTKNKSVYAERRGGIHPGWTVQLCNDIKDIDHPNINYEWYIKETEKLVKPLLA